MKKILAASSALAALSVAGLAHASEPVKLSVGGYMEQYVGVTDQDDELGSSHNRIQSDTEIHFSGSTTLDNGIEVGAKIEMEGESGNNIDEQYLFINGGFGQVKLGAEDGAASDMAIQAPSAGGYGPNDGDLADWVNVDNIDLNNYSGDTQKITYYTPVIGGFRAGLSYADSNESEGDDTRELSGFEASVWSGGLEYRSDFDGVAIALSATGEYTNPRIGNGGFGELDADNGKSYSIGANVGFGNFTVGGSYGKSDEWYNAAIDSEDQVVGAGDPLTTVRSLDSSTDREGFDLGVSYAMDAATVALTYAWEERDNYVADGTGNTLVSDGTEDEIQALSLGMNYVLGAGVTWQANVFWTEVDADDNADDGDAYGAVTGIRLDF